MHSCSNLSGDPVVITAPSLEYLEMGIPHGCYSNGISVRVTASLVKASIALVSEEAFSLENQRRLLVDLCNVPDLELINFQTKLIVSMSLLSSFG
ncbi:hypothetical protein BAE44_0017991 [Dichanthelium oligosanthes]|uniref:Uncharacterized protein n=1 Tax=Dichanthelium oligosanthes TaxID=888268 RepID=A0A1E5V744_9POAL|nr:hypothetical protein BAE44_0017991 [Dichanthelium oligosanthes]